ncbi:hypothetical protein LOTGIDRAFT_239341 [Lottia gigantea]|uniref:Carbonic anhydrase n=1 Tax=Lottia gigantea TaxID=225164 RepID=V3ZXK9_LOTGI|nr:hypothetical protein LOTGIDRAFT_239341 [Lottia gigantea]ESO96283.1 hypothetical protein LOTGIDRAFT_239341 [Lottia gigantea]
MAFTLVLTLSMLGYCSAAGGSLWGYEKDGAAKWKDTFATCGLNSQSPIDIQTEGVVVKNDLGTFKLTGYGGSIGMNMSNNGHTAKVVFNGDLYVENGGLPAKYKLAQFHFHWGSDNTKGSEHIINGNAFPMEVHFVHFKDSLGSLGAAVSEPEGLAVLGFFFEISETDNKVLNNIIDHLANITDPSGNSEVVLSAQKFEDLLPKNLDNFYRYSGSLTTPPCSETVVWTVFEDTIKISSSQMAKFREMFSSEVDAQNNHVHLQNNYRPVQLLHSRKVYSSHNVNSASSLKGLGLMLTSLIAAIRL